MSDEECWERKIDIITELHLHKCFHISNKVKQGVSLCLIVLIMGGEVLKITINRKDKNQSWGFKIVGGVDVGLVLKVLRIVGVDTPAYESGLLEHDVIVSVGEELVTLMTHQQVVDTIKRVTGTSLELTVQRGDHIVPSLAECFPAGEEVSASKHKIITQFVWLLTMDYDILSLLTVVQSHSSFLKYLSAHQYIL